MQADCMWTSTAREYPRQTAANRAPSRARSAAKVSLESAACGPTRVTGASCATLTPPRRPKWRRSRVLATSRRCRPSRPADELFPADLDADGPRNPPAHGETRTFSDLTPRSPSAWPAPLRSGEPTSLTAAEPANDFHGRGRDAQPSGPHRRWFCPVSRKLGKVSECTQDMNAIATDSAIASAPSPRSHRAVTVGAR